MLNRLELTGRAVTHVREFIQPPCLLHAAAGKALLRMREAALAEAIQLEVVSGFRDFKRQVAIWTAKFNGERPLLDRSGREIRREELDEDGLIDSILIWSALPGASRHHWGTEIDVIDAIALPAGTRPRLEPGEYAAGGCFGRLSGWLDSNMHDFGFFRPYAQDRGGVQPEPWHLSFAAVAVRALELLQPDVLREALSATDMPGRDRVLARLPELYERYVLAVDAP
jgi:LAS superfamily LD-carboxypeptidase LdcB